MAKRFLRLLSAAVIVVLTDACNGSGDDLSDLPMSTGSTGDILLMMDSSQWKGELGTAIGEIFHEEAPGLPRDETRYSLHYIEPSKFNRILRTNRNLIFALTLDRNTTGSRTVRRFLTRESVERIRRDSALNVYTTSNVYAKGQEVMYLLGRTEDELIRYLQANKQRLQDFLDRRERERLMGSLFTGGTLKGMANILGQDCRCFIKVPFGYKLVMNTDDFVWFRRMDADSDRDLFISWKAYRDTSMFSMDSLIAFRNSIARKYLFEDPEIMDSYLVTETSIPFKPIITKRINFNNSFAVEVRGLWRTNHATMGGPFLAYATTDPSLSRLYYAEGFLYSPGKEQREMLRELEATLWTLRFTAKPTTTP